MSSRAAFSVVSVFVMLIALVSCTGSAPEILYPDAQLVLLVDPSSGERAEILRLFVAVRDPDGSDDPARIFLSHEEAELYWEFSRDEWAYLEYAGDDWYGMPDIRMPDGAPLPRGAYRITVEDAGLSRSETDLFLSSRPIDRDLSVPQLRVDGSQVRVIFDSNVVLRVYSRSGQMVVNRVVAPGVLPDDVARQIPDEAGLQAFVTTFGGEPRRESGPYSLPR